MAVALGGGNWPIHNYGPRKQVAVFELKGSHEFSKVLLENKGHRIPIGYLREFQKSSQSSGITTYAYLLATEQQPKIDMKLHAEPKKPLMNNFAWEKKVQGKGIFRNAVSLRAQTNVYMAQALPGNQNAVHSGTCCNCISLHIEDS